MPRKTMEELSLILNQIVESKEGKLLNEYNGLKSYIQLQCKNEHIWKTRADAIIKSNCWCRECSGKSHNIASDNFRSIVEKREE